MGFIITMSLIIYFLQWISKPEFTKGVTLIFANIGTGKTTLLSKLAQEEIKKMKKGKSKFKHIVSNAIISGVTYVPDIRKLIKTGALMDTLILIDEGSIIYNNRKMNMTEQEIEYFKLIRHYRSACTILSQSYDDIDVTLRRIYTNIYILTKLPIYTMIRPIKKRIGIDEISKQIIDEYHFKWFFSWRLFTRAKYFKYFNSWWIPENVPIHDVTKLEKQPEYQGRSIINRLFMFHKKVKTEDESAQQDHEVELA